MIVYHASYTEVTSPNTSHSREFLDFGPGFYVTVIYEQAVKYAERFKRRGKNAWINTYELDDASLKEKVTRFDAYDERWIDYVMACRTGQVPDDADVVIGGIADDQIFRTIDLYFSGLISKQDALQRLVYSKPNMQICIRSQMIIDQYLTFKSSEKL
ncbi:MAG: DUF3990 domain-containing protein [Bacteroidales bacterium]|nr:DUF3990 domain-containing protein [Bacteroidales bacterium]